MTVKMTQNDSENIPLRMTLLRLLKHCDLIMKNEKENLMGGYNLAIVVSLVGHPSLKAQPKNNAFSSKNLQPVGIALAASDDASSIFSELF